MIILNYLLLKGKQKARIQQCFLLFLLTCTLSSTYSQNRENIYVKLDSNEIHFSKTINSKTTIMQAKREVAGYLFTLECCNNRNGFIGFYGHNNPETGVLFDSVRTVSRNFFNDKKLLSPKDLIGLVLKEDVEINQKYNIYFIEQVRGEYHLYHVRLLNSLREE